MCCRHHSQPTPSPAPAAANCLRPIYLNYATLVQLTSQPRRAIMSKFWVLVGSFSPFITTLQFTASPPTLSFVSQATSGTSPSWVAQSPKFPTTIYATDEVEAGSINTLSLDINTGNLTKLANISTQGNSPTHLGFINQGAAIGAANFGNGSAFIVNLETTNTGQFTGTGAKVAFQGSGPNPNSQTGPHAHQVSRSLIRRIYTHG
jgi:6-phosphogluconolactonase (cycloisomerase 2 family)